MLTKIVRVLVASLSFLLLLEGCEQQTNKWTVVSGDTLQLFPKETSQEQQTDDISETIAKYSPESGLICVLFGYGFNSQEFYDDAIEKLSKRYGLADNGGIILPVSFPAAVKGRISNLYDIINERDIKGIILLGAPDGTHKTLGRLKDDWKEEEATGHEVPYPVFSFMPQDDILGQESNCDFVLEYEQNTVLTEEDENINIIIDETAEEIVMRAVRYIEELPAPLPHDTNLYSHVQAIVGEKKVRRYTDGETGLQSINHFIIEK